MARGDIRLSEKHGVNPSLGVCFWCGQDDGTILLVGKLPGDAEAPRKMMVSYEPCPTCADQFALGIAIFECNEWGVEGQASITPKGQQPVLYPTGRLVVMREAAVERIFDDAVTEQIIRKRKAYIDPEAFEALFGALPGSGEEIVVPPSVMERPDG